MVGFDVGDDDRRRREVRERLVGFVGLHHVVAARSRMRVRAPRAHDAADEERRGRLHRVERGGEHRGRGGLAVRARDGKRVEPAAKAREHLGAMADGKPPPLRLDKLGVVLENGRGDDHRGVSLRYVRRLLADEHLHAELLELLGVAAFLEVGAAHAHALVMRHMRNAAHADAADADEVHRLDGAPFLLVHGKPASLNVPCRRRLTAAGAELLYMRRYARAAAITTSAKFAAASAVLRARAAALMAARTSASSTSASTLALNSSPITSASGSM